MDGDLLVEKASAKINLGLKVVGRRTDGYHEIRSIMQTVDLVDVLHFRAAPENRLTCTNPDLSTGPDNLVLRAVALFGERLGSWSRSFHIHLEKEIPTGAGLGGGSADAAATLRGLNQICGTPFETDVLCEMGACLGSDIPFLIEGGTALVRGRGEILEPLQWSGRLFYVLAYPGVAVGTAWAYRQLSPGLTGTGPYLKFIDSLSGGCVDHETLIRALENDFQPVVERAYPIVAELRAYLDSAGARASSMSGSGSVVYGIFDDRKAALGVRQKLQEQDYRSFLCQPSLPGAGDF